MWENVVGGSLGTLMGHGNGGGIVGVDVGCLGGCVKRCADLSFGSFGGFFTLGSAVGFLFPRMLWTRFVASSPKVVL